MNLLGIAIRKVQPELKNTKIALKVKGQDQMSPTSNHFQRFPWDIFLPSYFLDFVRTDTQTDRQTHRLTPPKTIPARSTSIAGARVVTLFVV